MKNLVMAAAKSYGWQELEPFIISFKKNISNADLVLFVDDISEFALNRLREENLTLIQISDELKNKLIVNARWEMYKNFLDEHTEYENIFITDIRDVIFQGDIFSNCADSPKFLIYAAAHVLIQNNPTNQNWMRHLVGETACQKIQDNPIICCGTVLGTRAELDILFVRMIEILKHSNTWGDEQAAINYLVYNKLLPIENLIASDVQSGAIFTGGLVKDCKIAEDNILRGDGNIPAVVHQYNIHSDCLKLVDRIYREENFEPNENFNDVSSILDQISCFVQRQNFSAATKFFVNYILYEDNLTPYNEKILKLSQLILQRYTSDAEILFMAIQKILVKVFKVNTDNQQLNKLYELLIDSEKNSCIVNPEFKNFIRNVLVTFTDVFYKNNLPNLGLLCVQRLSKIGGEK